MIRLLRRYGLTLTLLLIGVAIWWLREPPAGTVYELVGQTMGTTYSVKLAELPDQPTPEAVAAEIAHRLQRLDRELMSTYAPESELSRFNRSAPGEFFPVSPELAAVVQLAEEISVLTDGAFDVTVGPLVNRWGFGPRNTNSSELSARRLPEDAEIDRLLQQVSYHLLQVRSEPPALRKLAPIYVDLSAIAKGFAVDQLALYLDSLDIGSYFVEIGGELRIKGFRPDGGSWVPAIERPLDTAPQVHAVFYSHGQSIAVAGSGDYRNYFEENGQRYSHEIDPRTGRPISHSLAAVYVISDAAARADALATAFMVLGEQDAFELAAQEDIAAYFITRAASGDGFQDRHTDSFTQYLQQPE